MPIEVMERFTLDVERLDIPIASSRRHHGATHVRVPALLYRRPGAHAPGRAVICLHGRSASKLATFSQCARLASLGYTAVAIDLPGHGERPRFPAGPDGEEQRSSTVPTAVSEVTAVAELLLGDESILPGRYALIGFSLGAVVALHAAARDRRAGAVIALMGAPLAHIEAMSAGDLPPLLLVCGARDPAFPAEAVESFYNSLKERRPDADVTLFTFDVGHYTTKEIEVAAFDWLCSRLPPT